MNISQVAFLPQSYQRAFWLNHASHFAKTYPVPPDRSNDSDFIPPIVAYVSMLRSQVTIHTSTCGDVQSKQLTMAACDVSPHNLCSLSDIVRWLLISRTNCKFSHTLWLKVVVWPSTLALFPKGRNLGEMVWCEKSFCVDSSAKILLDDQDWISRAEHDNQHTE